MESRSRRKKYFPTPPFSLRVPCALCPALSCCVLPGTTQTGTRRPGTRYEGLRYDMNSSVCESSIYEYISISGMLDPHGWVSCVVLDCDEVCTYVWTYTIRDGLNWSASAPSFRINHQEKTDRTTTTAEGQRAAQPAAEGSRRSRIALFITDGCIFKIIRIFVARYEYEILVHDGNYKGGSLGPFFKTIKMESYPVQQITHQIRSYDVVINCCLL